MAFLRHGMHPAPPGWLWACSRAPLAASWGGPLLSPRPASEPRFSGSPSYLCPRSGRLLVPRPQSPFDPLLGSEPCDPVGGPRSQAASAARLRGWGESSAPFVPCSLAPAAGGLQVARPPGGSPRARRWGRERRLPGAPHPRPADHSGSLGEGRRELGLHAGPRFSAAEQKKGALCGHSYLFVNIWPARLSG